MKKELAKLIKHTAVLGVGSALIGMLLLVLVYCLPTDLIRRHVEASYANLICGEEEMPRQRILRYIWENKETFTDCIMVQYAFEKIPGRNAFEHAVWAYHSDLSDGVGWYPEKSLGVLLQGEDTSGMYLREYSRYWHGYLVYLKPLLLVFTWGQLLVVQTVLQIALMAAVAAAACRKKHPGAAAAMLAGALFLKLPLIMASLDMSVCWMITLSALLVLLLRQERLEEKGLYSEFFLCVGMMTSYFDFLTYPAVTLGFPLCTLFLIKKRESIRENLKKLIGCPFFWGIGYAGMWASKWLIADLTLHTGTIKNALWTVLGITSGIYGHNFMARVYGGFHAVDLNLQEYEGLFYRVLLILLAAGILTALARAVYRKVPLLRVLGITAIYTVIAAIPFAWIMAAQYHSALHARFTFRILSVSVMAGFGLTVSLWRQGTDEPGKENRE